MRLLVLLVAATRPTWECEKRQPMIQQLHRLFLDELRLAVRRQHRAAQLFAQPHCPLVAAKNDARQSQQDGLLKAQ